MANTWPESCPTCGGEWKIKSKTMGKANGQPHQGTCVNGHHWYEGTQPAPEPKVGEPFTRPQLEVFLAGLLMSKDGEATIPADVVRAAEAAADGLRMVQKCHVSGDITIELLLPWPAPCSRQYVSKAMLDDGKCWRCGWEPEAHLLARARRA